MGRLIREEDVLKVLTKEELLCGTFTEAKIAVGDIPTAYDVEAVVKELAENQEGFFVRGHLFVRTIPLDKAIAIVKRGGRNDIPT